MLIARARTIDYKGVTLDAAEVGTRVGVHGFTSWALRDSIEMKSIDWHLAFGWRP